MFYDVVVVQFRMLFATELEWYRALKYYVALLKVDGWIQWIDLDRDVLLNPSARRECNDETGRRVYRTMETQKVFLNGPKEMNNY